MKSKRHAKILELISSHAIDTQEELLGLLNQEGFKATQATVSRDIKELRLVKTQAADGRYRYVTGIRQEKADISFKFHAIFAESATSVDYAGNMVCVRCYTGMANAACAALDSIHWQGVVGTLAGDDTIFVLVRTQENAQALCDQLKKMLAHDNH